MPKPESEDWLLPAAAEMPMPRASTRGTVIGPVATAPQSQARPRMLESSASPIM